jgi:hypothetical protein
MVAVVDTDILSTFAKINKLRLQPRLRDALHQTGMKMGDLILQALVIFAQRGGSGWVWTQ